MGVPSEGREGWWLLVRGGDGSGERGGVREWLLVR